MKSILIAGLLASVSVPAWAVPPSVTPPGLQIGTATGTAYDGALGASAATTASNAVKRSGDVSTGAQVALYFAGTGTLSGLTYGTAGTYIGRSVAASEGDVVGVGGLNLYTANASGSSSILGIAIATDGTTRFPWTITASTLNVNQESHYSSGSYVDPHSGYSAALKASGTSSGTTAISWIYGAYGDTLTLSSSINFGSLDAITPSTITAPSSGTAPSGATALSKTVSRLTTCSTTQPAQLPAGQAAGFSAQYVVLNRSGATCTIYPPSGGQIENGGANVPVTIASGTDATFRSMSPTTWYQ